MRIFDNKICDLIVGETYSYVKEMCEKDNITLRLLREDDKNYIMTMDFRFDRINVEVDNGVVTKCDVG